MNVQNVNLLSPGVICWTRIKLLRFMTVYGIWFSMKVYFNKWVLKILYKKWRAEQYLLRIKILHNDTRACLIYFVVGVFIII